MAKLAQQLRVVPPDQKVAQGGANHEIGQIGRVNGVGFFRGPPLLEHRGEGRGHRVQGPLELIEHERRLDGDESANRVLVLELDDEAQRAIEPGRTGKTFEGFGQL